MYPRFSEWIEYDISLEDPIINIIRDPHINVDTKIARLSEVSLDPRLESYMNFLLAQLLYHDGSPEYRKKIVSYCDKVLEQSLYLPAELKQDCLIMKVHGVYVSPDGSIWSKVIRHEQLDLLMEAFDINPERFRGYCSTDHLILDAVRLKRTDILENLRGRVDFNVLSHWEEPALLIAEMFPEKECVDILLEGGADPFFGKEHSVIRYLLTRNMKDRVEIYMDHLIKTVPRELSSKLKEIKREYEDYYDFEDPDIIDSLIK